MIDKPRTLFHALKLWGHDMDFEPLLIPAPTEARPGSIEKVEIMRARLMAGEDLYHSDDAAICATKENNNLLHLFVVKEAKAKRKANRTDERYAKLYERVAATQAKRLKARIKPGRKYPENRAPVKGAKA